MKNGVFILMIRSWIKKIRVIVFKKSTKEIRISVFILEDGKASTIYEKMTEAIDKFDLWKSIKMIVLDTTSVNTGKKNGVITQLQNHFTSLGLPQPQFIGCQHHILDLLLRHVMDELLGGKCTSPNIYHQIYDISVCFGTNTFLRQT